MLPCCQSPSSLLPVTKMEETVSHISLDSLCWSKGGTRSNRHSEPPDGYFCNRASIDRRYDQLELHQLRAMSERSVQGSSNQGFKCLEPEGDCTSISLERLLPSPCPSHTQSKPTGPATWSLAGNLMGQLDMRTPLFSGALKVSRSLWLVLEDWWTAKSSETILQQSSVDRCAAVDVWRSEDNLQGEFSPLFLVQWPFSLCLFS